MSDQDTKTEKVEKVDTWAHMSKLPEFTAEEVAKHNTEEDIWIIMHGLVYNVTEFQNDHPGGPEIMAQSQGEDATSEFEDTHHSAKAREQAKELIVGRLKGYEGPFDAIISAPAEGMG